MSGGTGKDGMVVAASRGGARTEGAAATSVAVLCAPSRARVAAAAVALALARAIGSPSALAAAVGAGAPAPLGGTLAARRSAAALHASGHAAAARGRLVWLGDRRGDEATDAAAARAAALCAEIGRAASAVVPAAVVLPLPRSDALDRVLAWHHGIVVVLEPGTAETLAAGALASLAALGRPVAAMVPPTRLAATAALGGIATTAEATGAVARLGFDRKGAA